jgi:hypothetical protein
VRFARAVAKQMWSTGYHHLETSWLREPGDDRDIERLGYSGKDLPGFIAHLQRADSQRFDAILSSMRELLPHLDRIIVNRVGPDRQGLAMTFKDQRGYVNSPDLSDGTLFTLGLLAITRADKLPRLLCIEEPETGLHPRRLRWLFDRFVELAYPNDGQAEAVQVILTSHSPHLVDLFKDMQASVSVVEQDNGRTKITSLLDVKNGPPACSRASDMKVGLLVEGNDHLIVRTLLAVLLEVDEPTIEADPLDQPGLGWQVVLEVAPKALKRFYGTCSVLAVVGVDNDGNCTGEEDPRHLRHWLHAPEHREHCRHWATREDVENRALPLLRSLTQEHVRRLREHSRSCDQFAAQVVALKEHAGLAKGCWR